MTAPERPAPDAGITIRLSREDAWEIREVLDLRVRKHDAQYPGGYRGPYMQSERRIRDLLAAALHAQPKEQP